jgi:hemolysin activation/secretion protein
MRNKKQTLVFLLYLLTVFSGKTATLVPEKSIRNADGTFECTWLIKDLGSSFDSVRIEFADVDQYVKAGFRPPSSFTNSNLLVKSDGRDTKLYMRFKAEEIKGKVGLLVDGQTYWVDLASAEASTLDIASKKEAPLRNADESNKSMKIIGVKVTGHPYIGKVVGVDFNVLSTNRKDPLGRVRVSWLSGVSRKVVANGKSYLVHEDDRNQPLYALITPYSKSGVRGQSKEVLISKVIQDVKRSLPETINPIAVIPHQRIWSIPVPAIVNGKNQYLTVSMNASEYLTQSELVHVVKESFAEGVSTQSLRNLVEKIDELYAKQKLGNFKALVPEQNFSDGVVQLTLMEPVIGNITLSGNESEAHLEMVSNRLGLRSGHVLNVEDLDEKVQIFNIRNRAKARTLLAPGEGLGESDVHIEITPAPKAELLANYNNTGSEATGRQMRSVKGTIYGQIYGTEVIGLSRVESKTLSVTAASLDLPLINRNLVLGLGRTEIGNQPIDNPVDINSNGSTSYIQITKPWIFSSLESVDLSIRKSHVVNGTSYLGQTLKAHTTANKWIFGASYDLFVNKDWSKSRLTSGIQYTRIDTNSVNISNDVSSSRVGMLTYNALFQIDETTGWGGKVEFNAQPQRKLMSSADKFVVGMDNVRAYKPGTAVGDAGMSLSVDVYKSTYFDVDSVGTKILTQPYVFYDSAVVYNGANYFASDSYKAFGLGMKVPLYAAYKGFSFDLYRARPLSEGVNKPSSDRYGFSLNYLY